MLADVGARTGLGRDDGGAAALLVAQDAELRRLDAAGQVHIEHSAQLLQQLKHSSSPSSAADITTWKMVTVEIKIKKLPKPAMGSYVQKQMLLYDGGADISGQTSRQGKNVEQECPQALPENLWLPQFLIWASNSDSHHG